MTCRTLLAPEGVQTQDPRDHGYFLVSGRTPMPRLKASKVNVE